MLLQLLRIIDANLNRSTEGLRVLEDIARFLLDDDRLTQELRAIRHKLADETKSLGIELLSQRDSEHDVGVSKENIIASLTSDSERSEEEEAANVSQRDLPGVIRANAKRVEESLRVMEELAKSPELKTVLNSAKFEEARFTSYALERELISKILRQDKIKKLSGLYVILDRQMLSGRDEIDAAGRIIEGGARIIQLRDKKGSKSELLPIAQKLRELCAKAGILFIINDYLDIALAVNADGLHIGQGDLPLPIIRRELPIDKIVGCSVDTVPQAIRAQEKGADYIAVGSIFPTATKEDATVVGIDRLKEVKEVVSCPLVAIGGINEDNIGRVIATGADSVAVISAVLAKEDIKRTVEQLVAKMGWK